MASNEQQYEGDDLQGDLELEGGEDMVDAAAEQELESMKARLAAMEQEAAKLKEQQDKAQKEAGMGPGGGGGATSAADAAAKEEADSRSVYVGGVDYSCTPEELQMHFQSCGTVNRVTILTDKGGNPKGFAYIEFLEADAVANACLLDGSELRSRQIKVAPKRTNVPGMKQVRGGRGGRGRGGRGGFPYGGYGMMPMMPPPFMFGYGGFPYGGGGRGRGRGRGGRGGYQPY